MSMIDPRILRIQISELMEQNDEFESRDVRVSVSENCVTLSGEVDSPATKKLVCEMVGKIRGVREIIDELTVAEL